MASGRERFERRVGPAVADTLEPGEVVRASGYAMTPPSRAAIALAGGLAALTSHHYWVVVTDRRLVLFRMTKVGTTPELERATPVTAVRVASVRRTLLDVRLEFTAGDEGYRLRFPVQWKSAGLALASALAGPTSRV